MIAAVRGEVLVRRPDHVVIDAGGVGYRLTVSAETLKAVPATGARGLPARRADLPRRLARALRLRLRGGARPLRRAGLGQRGRPQGRDRGPLRRPGARAAAGDRRRRRQALPGGAGDRQADRGADHRRAAREGRRRARGGGRRRRSPRAATPATSPATASSTSATRRSRPSSCSTGIESDDAEELIAAALRKAGDREGGMSDEADQPEPDPDARDRRASRCPVDAEVRVHDAAGRRPRRGPRPLAAAADPRRLRQPGAGHRAARDLHRGRPRPRRAARPRPARRPARASARPRSPTSSPPRWGCRWCRPPGPALERKADVASFLTALEPGSVFFVDEIHRLGRAVEETLYPAMEDGELPVVLGQGAGARTVTLPLPPFTLIGATTRAGLLTTPLRDRFGVCHRLEHYDPEHLAEIVVRSAGDPRGRDRRRGRARRSPAARAARRGSPTGC